jgi:large subunit ribosomal protein L5
MADDKKHEEKKPPKAPKQDGGGKGGGKGKGGKAEAAAPPAEAKVYPKVPARLKERYKSEILPALMKMKEFGFKNPNQVPRLEKIVVNMGMGEAISNNKLLDAAVIELTALSGQKPVITKSRKAIANFKLREGQSIGVMVTLRKERMYEFFDRLVNIAMPRVRDFKGLSPKAFDGNGNYTLGIKEQVIFPEVNVDKVEKTKGMNVTIVTSARNDDEGRALLKLMGMPFREAAPVPAPAARPPAPTPAAEAKVSEPKA